MDPDEVDRDKVDPKASQLYDLSKRLPKVVKPERPAGKRSPHRLSETKASKSPVSNWRARRERTKRVVKEGRAARELRLDRERRERQQRPIEKAREERAAQRRMLKQREAVNRPDLKEIVERMRSSRGKAASKPPAKGNSSQPTGGHRRGRVSRVRNEGAFQFATDRQAKELRYLISTRQLQLSPKVNEVCFAMSAQDFADWRESMSQVPSGLTATGAAAWIKELKPLPPIR